MSRMPRTRTLAIIQAGGAGSRMDVLTRERAKPSLPFAGIYQLVDFPLSNLAHSGITDVWLSVSYLGSSLEQEVANGRPWDLDRNRGGLRLLMPQEGTGSTDEEGFAQRQRRRALPAARPDPRRAPRRTPRDERRPRLPLRLPGRDRAPTCEPGAACTVVTTERPLEEAGDHACVRGRRRRRRHRLRLQARGAATTTVAAEIMVYDPDVLVDGPRGAAPRARRRLPAPATPGSSDFGDHLLPRLVERHRVVAHAMPGYWRDVGEPHKYVEAHRELLRDDHDVFDHPDWPILTRQPQRAPARVLDGAVGRRQPGEPGVPGRGPGRAQRARPGRRRRGRSDGPRQRGVRRHGRRGRARRWTGRSSTSGAGSGRAPASASRDPTGSDAGGPGPGQRGRPRDPASRQGRCWTPGSRLEPGSTG